MEKIYITAYLAIVSLGNYFISATPLNLYPRREPNLPQSNVQVPYNITKSELGGSDLEEVSYIDFDISSSRRPRTCNDCVCGISRSSRIVNGNITEFFEFPWIASIHIEGRYQCGGSLITSKHILTVSHCLFTEDPQEYRIILADNNLPNSEEYSIERRVASIRMHEAYDSTSKNNDIGIIELDQPVPLDGSIQTACLPENKPIDYSGALAVAVGRGQTGEDEPLSDELRKVYVHILPEEECKKAGYTKGKVTENMFCAGYLDGQYDSCSGDSGGPLHVKASHGFMEVIGLISWGRGCARPRFPGVYTRVTKYMDWIANQLDQDGACVCQHPH